MKFSHKHIIKFQDSILSVYNFFNFFLNFKPNEIRVLIYHHIEKKEYHKFYKQLFFIKKKWNFITPKQFEDHINKKIKLKGKNILLTFDDGFSSNFSIENKVLSKLKIKSIFFVPSDFVIINSSKKARLFIKNNILDQNIPSDFNSIKNMSIKNLKQLIKKGHTIGAHTKTHANLGLIKNKKKLYNEMVFSLRQLEKNLEKKINHFAFTYGNYESMSKNSLKIAFKHYKYVYSSLRGGNYSNKKNEIIKRDAIYLEHGNKLLTVFVNGITDLKYFIHILKINKLIKYLKNKNKFK